jgi:alkylated DNA repair dioxygenase AlkB
MNKMEGINYIDNFIDNPAELFNILTSRVKWDERMTARKTASFGKAYNYSQIDYPYQEFLPELEIIIKRLKPVIGFEPNNCLINFYMDGKSKMGYHSDQTDILEADTGIAIISIGEQRILKFKNIENPDQFLTYDLTSGSLVYMTQEIQRIWQHSIPKSDTENGRISLTFRQIR